MDGVEILESSTARVHVRWSYQSCDFKYKIWGDSAVEDFYFYPDGFGTRVLTLQSALDSDYELSEFIILTRRKPTRSVCFPRISSTSCSSMARNDTYCFLILPLNRDPSSNHATFLRFIAYGFIRTTP